MKKILVEDYLATHDIIQDQIDDLIFELMRERKKNKISQVKLSKMTGVPQTTISRVESFRTTPTLQILIKLANALNYSLDFKKILKEHSCNSLKAPIE